MVKGFLNVGQSSLRPILVWALELWKLPTEYLASWWCEAYMGYAGWKPTRFRTFSCSLRSSMHPSGGNSVQDQLEVRSKFVNIQLLHSRPVNSCISVCISRGLISVQCFQLIHAFSHCADFVGVRFVGICARFCTRINENNKGSWTLTPNNCVYRTCCHGNTC